MLDFQQAEEAALDAAARGDIAMVYDIIDSASVTPEQLSQLKKGLGVVLAGNIAQLQGELDEHPKGVVYYRDWHPSTVRPHG